ncbi:KIR-like protein [Plasmodium coatneyi]|uniref:KIR-like protein n=1 Tax=Plasmodium coatneyi TaxID=208452 RepID=A0A1B1E200_9APIC|nr:KIR-like protein [Plasmodium coatneyi]ANQ08869.1 KIR-like protein [Plasmodium coatneyi]
MTKELDRKELPSHKEYYDKFNTPTRSECKSLGGDFQQWDGQLQNGLSEYHKITTDAKKIANAYCFACTQNKPSSYKNKEPCEFFYYWLGDKYWNDLGNHTFSNLLNKIYQTLHTSSHTNLCRTKYDDVPRELFQQRKTLFEWWHNHSVLQSLIQGSNSECSEQYGHHIEKAFSSYFSVSAFCTENKSKSDSYCMQFWTEQNQKDNLAKLLKLQCESESKLQTMEEGSRTCAQEKETLTKEKQSEAQATLSQAQTAASLAKEEAVRSATTTSSLSSIFGTLGMTVAPFLLYKYKPWSSWIGNHSGNGRSTRKRRSAEGTFDTFTENSSTYDSETESIVDDSTTENSTTLRSATYTAQSTRGGRTRNNAGRGIVGYQNM